THSTGVTNLVGSICVSSERLTNLQFTALAPELRRATLDPLTPDLSQMSFATTNNRILQPGQAIAQLSFTAISTQSAFVPLLLSNVTAIQTNDIALNRTIATSGRVVVVGAEPLLEALPSTNSQPTLILYGEPGAHFIVEQ